MIALTKATQGKKSAETWRDLMAYILEAYHDPLRAALPRLERLLDRVARERRVPIHVLDWLLREFSALADSLRTHFVQQEEQLFPMIRHVCRSIEKTGWDCHRGAGVEELLDVATCENQEAVANVQRVETCLGATDWERKGPLVGKLVKGLHELREDLEEHVQLETNVLFPVVRELLRGRHGAIVRHLPQGSASQAEPPCVPCFRGPPPVSGTSPVPIRNGENMLPDRSVHASAFYHWLDPVMQKMGFGDRHRGYRAIRSVLHAVRDRLNVDDAIAIGMRLPRAVRGLYYEDWQHRWDPATHAKKEEFLSRVAQALEDEPNPDPDTTTRSVFRALAEYMPASEIESVGNTLPREIQSLWPWEAPATSMAEIIVGDQETG